MFFIPSCQLKTNALLIFGNKLSIHAYNKLSSKNPNVLGYLHSTSLTFDFTRSVPVPLIRIVKDYIICCHLNSFATISIFWYTQEHAMRCNNLVIPTGAISLDESDLKTLRSGFCFVIVHWGNSSTVVRLESSSEVASPLTIRVSGFAGLKEGSKISLFQILKSSKKTRPISFRLISIFRPFDIDSIQAGIWSNLKHQIG